ncbi:hypothetical protein [Pseudomonas sp. 18173]|uniref:hypothetical protein n=1 Tax=Pseudomonas sp. 18173 TaxID=3390055 RepID=UPI003D1942C4
MSTISTNDIIFNAAIGKKYSEALRAVLSELTGRDVCALGGGYLDGLIAAPEHVILHLDDDQMITSYSFD